MAVEGNLIDFDVIESSKENIQALPSGRSAKALAQIFSPVAQQSPSNTQDIHDAARQEFEKELTLINDVDDPLDVYDRYVKWTLDAYPTAQATPSSQLLPLLERATKAFVASKQYKNDPRYLKIWLHYIRFFSDAPRETFAYLARHGIGESLALYYEEFAAWLETAGRWNQAAEVYQMGLEKDAQPAERIMRRFHEFEQRLQARPQEAEQPSSPALPTVRPALSSKFDPHASTSPSASDPQAASRAQGQAKPKKGKIEIFSDSGEESRPSSHSSAHGWENIGSLAERKKENVVSAKPWQGETLPTSGSRMGVPKMMIYKDETLARMNGSLHADRSIRLAFDHPSREQRSRNARSGKLEHVFANLEAVYPNPSDPSEEYTFEELRLARRGLLSIDWSKQPQLPSAASRSKLSKKRPFEIAHDETLNIALEPEMPKKKGRAFEIAKDDTMNLQEQVKIVSKQQTLALNDVNDENDENVDPEQAQRKAELARQMRREEKANRTRKIMMTETSETQTVQTNLDSPAKPKIKRKKTREPTMTLHTKAATDEVYELFNAPLKSQVQQVEESEEESEEESSDEDSEDEDDYNSIADSTTGRISASASDYGDETRDVADGEATETNNTGWTDFDPRDAQSHESETEESTTHTHETTRETTASQGDLTQTTEADSSDSEMTDGDAEIDEEDTAPVNITEPSVSTPPSPTPAADNMDAPRTRYVPMPPEDYHAPTHPYRDPEMIAQSRLPFMTPIVEATESSVGAATAYAREREEQSAKTPCPKNGRMLLDVADDGEDEYTDSQTMDEGANLASSPFTNDTADSTTVKDEPVPKLRMPQPEPQQQSEKQPLAMRAKSTAQQASSAFRVNKSVARPKEQKGPIIKDAQVNPMDQSVRTMILQGIQPPLESFDGYFSYAGQTFGRRGEVKRYVKAVAAKKEATIPAQPTLNLPQARRKYTIKRELGAGAYAPVYLVESVDAVAPDEDGAAMHKGAFSTRRSLEAVKSEDPPSAWEFYMLACAHRRLGVSRAAASVVRAHEMHLFDDECYLIEDYRSTGTMLDLVNAAGELGIAGSSSSGAGPGSLGAGVDETLAMFFAVELLRTVEALHSKSLIHGDLKPDNVLVRLDPSTDSDPHPSSTFQRDGSAGWAAKGVMLIDLGRGIDARQFLPTANFLADWPTTATDCTEMREARPWTYQIDYFGLAGILHVLLFGRYIDTVADKGGAIMGGGVKTYRLKEGLKRYWQTDLWAECFGVLLNPVREVEAHGEAGRLPVTGALRRVRERMEGWLEANGERGMGLRGLLRRIESGKRR